MLGLILLKWVNGSHFGFLVDAPPSKYRIILMLIFVRASLKIAVLGRLTEDVWPRLRHVPYFIILRTLRESKTLAYAFRY